MPPQTTLTSRRRPSRGRRLARTGLIALLIAGGGAAVVRLVGRGEPERPTPLVAVSATTISVAQGTKPPAGEAENESKRIATMIQRWYQAAFVDPEQWGDGTFPQVRANFTEQAQAAFDREIESLTIGGARELLERVEPGALTARITVYFDERPDATFAVAKIRFRATGTLKKEESLPLEIDQHATLHLRRDDARQWVIFAFDASQTQQEAATATPEPGASG